MPRKSELVDYIRELFERAKVTVYDDDEVLDEIISLADGVTISDVLTVSSAAPESRIGYATIGYAEIA